MLLIYLTTEHSEWVHHDKIETKRNKKENDIILCNLMDKKKTFKLFGCWYGGDAGGCEV